MKDNNLKNFIDSLTDCVVFVADEDVLVSSLVGLLSVEDVTIRDLISLHSSSLSILESLFGRNLPILDCTEYKWYINKEGYIVIITTDDEYTDLLYIVSKYIGLIGKTACFLTTIHAPGTHFHGFNSGLIVDSEKYFEYFDDYKIRKALYIVDDAKILNKLLDRSTLVQNGICCSICKNTATVLTFDGWFCEECINLLNISKKHK